MNTRPESIAAPPRDIGRQIDEYPATLRQLESDLWNNDISNQSVSHYQKAFRDYEGLLAEYKDTDDRAHFIITIPVADRPRQLRNCMQSLLALSENFMYGGSHNGKYNKISVVVADDSAKQENITRNQSLCRQYNKAGLNIEYFGLHEQIDLLCSLPDSLKKSLEPALGKISGELDESSFSHKGASIVRNITYLHLHKLSMQYDNALIYFIDSDQEFCVNITNSNEEKNFYAINYFHHINEIFTTRNVDILTGKVVGDPPVSPTVMAGKFLNDVISFLQQISKVAPDSSCEFHTTRKSQDDASYHDMATLFGFTADHDVHEYHCRLTGRHTNRDCIREFSSRLNNFFHGEHPTRSSQFAYSGNLSTTTSARTVYTGNYIFKPEILTNFIAFANLHLRMAGPTLGRLLKASMGNKFASANLPMLHSRTINSTGHSEFRPDIEQSTNSIDLSGEFERQYYGDVMLFTVDKLTQSGYPKQTVSEDTIRDTLINTEINIHKQYLEKHAHIIRQVSNLNNMIKLPNQWWNTTHEELITRHLKLFTDNIINNFGDQSPAYHSINSKEKKQRWLTSLLQAISSHKATEAAWKQLFE